MLHVNNLGTKGAVSDAGQLRQSLVRYVRRRAPAEDVDDLVQDILLKVLEKLHQVDDETRMTAWIYQVARSVVVDHLRRRPKQSPLAEAEPPAEQPEELDELSPKVASWLLPMVNKLEPPYREILELTELSDVSQRQAADRLGLSPSGARTRVQRARAQLRKELLRCCQIELDARNRVMDVHPNKPDCC